MICVLACVYYGLCVIAHIWFTCIPSPYFMHGWFYTMCVCACSVYWLCWPRAARVGLLPSSVRSLLPVCSTKSACRALGVLVSWSLTTSQIANQKQARSGLRRLCTLRKCVRGIHGSQLPEQKGMPVCSGWKECLRREHP